VTALEAGDFDEVLHQPTRARIMTYLFFNRQAPLSRLRADLALTPGNAATHLARLAEAGYVESRRVLAGVFEVRVFVTDAGVRAFEAYVAQLKALVDRVQGEP
jgi:DNA-binding MarR family transcriptional regulator